MNNAIIILLTILALIEAFRAWKTFAPDSKKKHFKMKRDGTQKMIWDLEFKAHKTLQIREEIRQEYDFMNSRIEAFTKQIEATEDKEQREKLEENLKIATSDSERLKQQILGLDLEVTGSKPTKELPEGHTGINMQIDSLRELLGMLNSWIKTL